MRYYYNKKFRVLGDLNNEWISFAARFCIPEDNTRERKKNLTPTQTSGSPVWKNGYRYCQHWTSASR